jgi:hypothetical protein
LIRDDPDILESRIQAVRELPWALSSLTILEMTDLDLDHLDMAADSPHYWSVLNAIVTRIEREAHEHT